MHHLLKLLLVPFVLLVLLVPLSAASSPQAYQDYLYQFDVYRTKYNDFKVAKNEYEKFKSLGSQTAALEKTREMLAQRDQLLRAYLLLLNEKLNENPGLTASERQLYQSLIRNEVVFLENHSQLIPSIGTLEDAEDVSDQMVSHYEILSASIRQTIVALSLGQLVAVANRFDDTVSQAQRLVTTSRATFTPAKQATLDRWLLAISNKKSLYQQKIDTIRQTNSQLEGDLDELDRQFNQLLKDLAEARQYLIEGTSFLRELTQSLRYQD